MATELVEPIHPPPNSHKGKAKEFVELHDQVQSSVTLLDSLESFLSTFQTDLTAVAGQISELQDRSKDIDSRLKSRRRIERPLSSLISDITIPPSLATLILDSNVGEPWIEAIDDFERRLNTSKARTRVKAARDLGEVAEGLRIVAATKLRSFFLALFQPIRSNVTTNMQVIQTSILLKYGPLFAFLKRQAPSVAQEVQRSYVGAARVYYETGFRRYSRSLGWIKARTVEKFETIVASEKEAEWNMNMERLQHARIDGPGATLAYMADDKTHKEPVEALLRSLFLVFMDNATAEYTFVNSFFSVNLSIPPVEPASGMLSPKLMISPTLDTGLFAEPRSATGSEYGEQQNSSANATGFATLSTSKEEQSNIDAIWKQIFDPVLEYCQTFLRSVLEPMPPIIPLLTMIRLTEDVGKEVQMRQCPPAETYIFTLRLQMWPIFQKAATEHVDALKKIAEGTSTGYFGRTAATTDTLVANMCKRYIVLFNSFIFLTEHEEETMIFSNLHRLRQELVKLISRHTNQISDTVRQATAQSTIYELLLQGLSKGMHHTAHPKSQQEIAYWANLEEEARRKIVSAGQSRSRR
ncbi:vacuolar sorting protein [Crucibulum laeve]|uniref:Vacuolar sorting protein n=1 Tax=Crucibulum laeve TaxID=68775 RepID=A0A5C3ME06_9AGAR|nr:vacuolar sorting protein [Crucibulum laeve]